VKVLAFDLSTRQGSIAIGQSECFPGNLLAQREWPNDQRNCAPFFSALDQIIRLHGMPNMIAVGLGPGSYTGTRIAISAAIGLQTSCGAFLCGLPSVCAMSNEDDFVVIGDARRASFFFSRINHGCIVGEPELLTEKQIANRISRTTLPIYTGDTLPQFPRAKICFPHAELLGGLSLRKENVVRAPLEPIYLRAPHITSPRLTKT